MAHNNSFGNHKKKGGGKLIFILLIIVLVILVIGAIMIERSGDLPTRTILIQKQLSVK